MKVQVPCLFKIVILLRAPRAAEVASSLLLNGIHCRSAGVIISYLHPNTDNRTSNNVDRLSMKRERSGDGDLDEQAGLKRTKADPQEAQDPEVKAEHAASDDEETIALPKSTTRSQQKQGRECPYLDTVSRQVSVLVKYR